LVGRDFYTPSHGSRSAHSRASTAKTLPSHVQPLAKAARGTPDSRPVSRPLVDTPATRGSRVAADPSPYVSLDVETAGLGSCTDGDTTTHDAPDLRRSSNDARSSFDDDEAPTGVSRLRDGSDDTRSPPAERDPRRNDRVAGRLDGTSTARRGSPRPETPAPRASRRSDVDLPETPARGSRGLDEDATAATHALRVASARDSRRIASATARGNGADILDTLPIIHAVVRDRARGVSPAVIARRFHNTLVELAARACVELARREGVRDVVLSGGVFANSILANELPARLRAFGLVPHLPRRVPPNDGGLSFGQLAAIAATDRGAS
jgi:hypothetical protein